MAILSKAGIFLDIHLREEFVSRLELWSIVSGEAILRCLDSLVCLVQAFTNIDTPWHRQDSRAISDADHNVIDSVCIALIPASLRVIDSDSLNVWFVTKISILSAYSVSNVLFIFLLIIVRVSKRLDLFFDNLLTAYDGTVLIRLPLHQDFQFRGRTDSLI